MNTKNYQIFGILPNIGILVWAIFVTRHHFPTDSAKHWSAKGGNERYRDVSTVRSLTPTKMYAQNRRPSANSAKAINIWYSVSIKSRRKLRGKKLRKKLRVSWLFWKPLRIRAGVRPRMLPKHWCAGFWIRECLQRKGLKSRYFIRTEITWKSENLMEMSVYKLLNFLKHVTLYRTARRS